jgi:hypothetical protein
LKSWKIRVVAGRIIGCRRARKSRRLAVRLANEEIGIKGGVAAAHDRLPFAKYILGEPKTRAEIVFISAAKTAWLPVHVGKHRASQQSTHRVYRVRIKVAGAVVDFVRLLLEIVAQSQIERQSARSGKLIFYHGVSALWFSALDTVDYYERMTRANGGAAKVMNWSRLFLVPGMGHCGGWPAALDTFDMLNAIVEWVGTRQSASLSHSYRQGVCRAHSATLPLPAACAVQGRRKPG